MPKNKNLLALNKVGQSIWYDNLSRDILGSGELASLVEQGVSGLTSNPTIFKKAIADTNDYDQEISSLIQKFSDPEDICEELMVQDVAAAADLLLPVFHQHSGDDGFASIEVSPRLAHDTDGTVTAAKRIWSKLSRPNAMIKIPATEEGIPAIRQTLAEGINVNVTLIFSPDEYQKVIDAYLDGLQEAKSNGNDISKIRSVASFFVSRVDAACEKEIDKKIISGILQEANKERYLGKVGIANSKVAYMLYNKALTSEKYISLKQSGATMQRPLWASTGTKNDAFSKVLYIEELAGNNTVNTVPPATLSALMEGAVIEPRLHEGLEQAQELLSQLSRDGVDLGSILSTLLEQGVDSFSQSYDQLTAALTQKLKAIG